MEYAKLQLRDTRTPRWRFASCAARGAAVSLLAFCADQETGGRIEKCRSWTDSEWGVAAGVTAADVEVAAASGLCAWDGEDLVVSLWDHIGERELQTKRDNGRFGYLGAEHGKKGGRPKRNGASAPPPADNGTPPAEEDPTVAAARPSADAVAAVAAERKASLTVGQFCAAHPRLVIFHDQRDRFASLFALYGWDACAEGVAALTPEAMARGPKRTGVTVKELGQWLEKSYDLKPDDYQRAGLPVPAGA